MGQKHLSNKKVRFSITEDQVPKILNFVAKS